jgi:hypothetical protein
MINFESSKLLEKETALQRLRNLEGLVRAWVRVSFSKVQWFCVEDEIWTDKLNIYDLE